MTTATNRNGTVKTALIISLCLFITGSLLSGCGWRLRGSQSLNTHLTELAVSYSDQYSLLANALNSALNQQGIAIVDAGQAPYTLYLQRENLERRSVSVGSNGLAAQYELTMQADFRVSGAQLDSNNLTVNVTRIYDYDQDDTIGKKAEEQIILKEMRQELANRILRQVSSLTSQATSTNPQ